MNPRSGKSRHTTPVTGKRRSGRWIAFIFSAVFFAMGTLLLYLFLIRPVTLSYAAADWPAVSCTVLTSEVGRHSDSDGTTYSVDITYRYTVDGREYTGDRYNFMGGSSSGRSGKAKVVKAHPPGSEHLVYVDPDDPTRAVLTRELGWEIWVGVIPAAFTVIGLVGMVLSLRIGRPSGATTANADASGAGGGAGATDAWLPAFARKLDRDRPAAGPVAVKPGLSRLGGLLVMIGFAAFWNGIVSVFVVGAVNDHLDDDLSWFLTIFLIPFVLVGLVLIGAVGHAFLKLFNPTVELTFDPPFIEPGGEVHVAWSLTGSTHRLRSLTLTLQGLEKTTYSRGTDTITDEHVFHDHEIHGSDSGASGGVGQVTKDGSATLSLPPTVMHTFKSRHNEVAWRVKLTADVARRPDLDEAYPLAVLPPAEPINRRGMF